MFEPNSEPLQEEPLVFEDYTQFWNQQFNQLETFLHTLNEEENQCSNPQAKPYI